MKNTQMALRFTDVSPQAEYTGAMIVGTGLAFASLILVPAVAAQIGLGVGLTGALRIALMKASNRAIRGKSGQGTVDAVASFSCH